MTIMLSRYDFEDILIYAERYDLDLNQSNLFLILDLLSVYSNRLSVKTKHVIINDINERMSDEYRVNISPLLRCNEILNVLLDSKNVSDSSGQIIIPKIDFETILVCAERYAIGRMTYAPHTVCEIINHQLNVLSIDTIKVLIADIEFNKNNNCLGNVMIDAPVWIKTLENLKQELTVRNMNENEISNYKAIG